MITILLKHPSFGILFPKGLDVSPGEQRLTTNVFQNMQLLRMDERDVYQKVEGANYLHIHTRNRQILDLTYPLIVMKWCLKSSVGVAMPEANLEIDADEPIRNASIPDAVAPVQQEHVMHPYHDMCMQ